MNKILIAFVLSMLSTGVGAAVIGEDTAVDSVSTPQAVTSSTSGSGGGGILTTANFKTSMAGKTGTFAGGIGTITPAVCGGFGGTPCTVTNTYNGTFTISGDGATAVISGCFKGPGAGCITAFANGTVTLTANPATRSYKWTNGTYSISITIGADGRFDIVGSSNGQGHGYFN